MSRKHNLVAMSLDGVDARTVHIAGHVPGIALGLIRLPKLLNELPLRA